MEDTALLTGKVAVVTRPGADSRREEAALMEPVLTERFAALARIEAPGTLDAGDVMMVGNCFYIGLSARTNEAGAEQLIAILRGHGYDGIAVPMAEMLHLKTGVNSLERNRLLVTGEFVGATVFEGFECIEVPFGEAYAANSLWINETVLVPAGFPQMLLPGVKALGYATLEVAVSSSRRWMRASAACLCVTELITGLGRHHGSLT